MKTYEAVWKTDDHMMHFNRRKVFEAQNMIDAFHYLMMHCGPGIKYDYRIKEVSRETLHSD